MRHFTHDVAYAGQEPQDMPTEKKVTALIKHHMSMGNAEACLLLDTLLLQLVLVFLIGDRTSRRNLQSSGSHSTQSGPLRSQSFGMENQLVVAPQLVLEHGKKAKLKGRRSRNCIVMGSGSMQTDLSLIV